MTEFNYSFSPSDHIHRTNDAASIFNAATKFSKDNDGDIPILCKFRVRAELLNKLLEAIEKTSKDVNIQLLTNTESVFIESTNSNKMDFFIVIDLESNPGGNKHFPLMLLTGSYFNNIVKLIDEFSIIKLKKNEFSINYYYVGSKGLETHNITKNINEFDYIISDIYPGLNVKSLYESYTNSKENILVLMGPAGVGKTTLIKYLLKQSSTDYYKRLEEPGYTDHDGPVDASQPVSATKTYYPDDEYGAMFAYAKGNEVLIKEEFWAALTNSRYKMLILDDLDFALMPREKQKNDFMSNFLSFADGIFDNETKIIMTTNLAFSEIDSAMLRTGRCFDILDLQKMPWDFALNLWKSKLNLSEGLFNQKFGNSEFILQSDLMSFYQTLNFKTDSLDYLQDDTISIRHSINRKRKVGFHAP